MWDAYGDRPRQSRGCSSAVPAELQAWSVGLRPGLLDAVTALLTDSHNAVEGGEWPLRVDTDALHFIDGFRVQTPIFHQDIDRKGTMGMLALPQEKGLPTAS